MWPYRRNSRPNSGASSLWHLTGKYLRALDRATCNKRRKDLFTVQYSERLMLILIINNTLSVGRGKDVCDPTTKYIYSIVTLLYNVISLSREYSQRHYIVVIYTDLFLSLIPAYKAYTNKLIKDYLKCFYQYVTSYSSYAMLPLLHSSLLDDLKKI